MLPGWQSAWNSLARAPVSAWPAPAPELDYQHQRTHRTTRAQALVNPRYQADRPDLSSASSRDQPCPDCPVRPNARAPLHQPALPRTALPDEAGGRWRRTGATDRRPLSRLAQRGMRHTGAPVLQQHAAVRLSDAREHQPRGRAPRGGQHRRSPLLHAGQQVAGPLPRMETGGRPSARALRGFCLACHPLFFMQACAVTACTRYARAAGGAWPRAASMRPRRRPSLPSGARPVPACAASGASWPGRLMASLHPSLNQFVAGGRGSDLPAR